MNDLTPTADVTGAAGLALAALTVLHGLWVPSIDSALAIERARHSSDRKPALSKMRATMWKLAVPLALAATLLLAALTPAAVSVTMTSMDKLRESGLAAFQHYQTERALFAVVWLFLAILTISTWLQVCRLGARIKDFR